MRSLKALFARYSAIHRQIRFRPQRIVAHNGETLGWIECERISGNVRSITGWLLVGRVSLVCSDKIEMTVVPSSPREDVQLIHGGDGKVGFSLHLPISVGSGETRIETESETLHFPFQQASKFRWFLEQARLGSQLIWICLRGLPSIVSYLTSSNAQERDMARQRLQTLLELNGPAKRTPQITPGSIGLPTQADMALADRSSGPPITKVQSVCIVLPVYNAFDLLQRCLDRLSKNTDVSWHLVIIEDCSTDGRVRPYLHEWMKHQPAGSVTLLENSNNLGFIGSVNRGLKQAIKRKEHVIFLNSDALVPPHWASRLLAPLVDPTVASVTPMCNDAEILNVPVICKRSDLQSGEGDFLDRIAAQYLKGAPGVDLPTGVGFCMAASADWLATYPTLDTIFGRGYGEEVDWCRKTLAKGARHIGLPSVFVDHCGGESFGSAEKRKLIEENGRIVSHRYPSFDAEVHEFIVNDPLIGPRLLLALAYAAHRQAQPMSIYVVHSLGGGAEDAMLRDLSILLEAGQAAVVLTVGGDATYELALHTEVGTTRGVIQDEESLNHLLNVLPTRKVIYICGVGDRNAYNLPTRLIKWAGTEVGSELIIEVHDFFPVSPSYTLLNSEGLFTGVPLPETHGQDLIHQGRAADGQPVSLAQWQTQWGAAMMRASQIVVFSRSSGDIITQVWPDCTPRITLRPHQPLHRVPTVARIPAAAPKTIGVLGNIGYQKGAKVLHDIAQRLIDTPAARLVVMGNIDPSYPLAQKTIIHGNYDRSDISILTKNYEIDCWLIPSIWPETFSFTTREALATGLPVWCFDLGAQAEALREAGQADHILPFENGRIDIDEVLKSILNSSTELTG